MHKFRVRTVTSLVREGFKAEMRRAQDGGSDLEDGLLQTHDFVELLRMTKGAAFDRTKLGHTVSSGEFDGFFELLRHPLPPEFLSHFELSPQINAFVQVCAMLRISARFWESANTLVPGGPSTKTAGESFNDAIALIRKRATSRTFDKSFEARRSTALRDCQTAEALIRQVSAMTRHIYAGRVDLMYGAHERAKLTAARAKRDLASPRTATQIPPPMATSNSST